MTHVTNSKSTRKKELFLFLKWFDIFVSCHIRGQNGCSICIYRMLIFMISFTTRNKLELHFLDGQNFYQHRQTFELILKNLTFDWLRAHQKLGCVVRMVVDSILLHVESGPNDHRKDAPPFSLNKDSTSGTNFFVIIYTETPLSCEISDRVAKSLVTSLKFSSTTKPSYNLESW